MFLRINEKNIYLYTPLFHDEGHRPITHDNNTYTIYTYRCMHGNIQKQTYYTFVCPNRFDLLKFA